MTSTISGHFTFLDPGVVQRFSLLIGPETRINYSITSINDTFNPQSCKKKDVFRFFIYKIRNDQCVRDLVGKTGTCTFVDVCNVLLTRTDIKLFCTKCFRLSPDLQWIPDKRLKGKFIRTQSHRTMNVGCRTIHYAPTKGFDSDVLVDKRDDLGSMYIKHRRSV